MNEPASHELKGVISMYLCSKTISTAAVGWAQPLRRLARLSLLVALPAAAAAQDPLFVDVSAERGISAYEQAVPTGGVQAVDFDQDGDIDLFVGHGPGVPDRLYQNDGTGYFEDIAPALGLDSIRGHRTALWIDFDGDGDLDLVRAGDCRLDPPVNTDLCDDPVLLQLHEQVSNGTFVDVTVAAGLDVAWGGQKNQHRGGLAAADLDGDGFVDLYVSTWNGRPYLFMNNGDGTFSDRTSESGISLEMLPYHQPIIHDFNRDSLLDIYQPVDFRRPNKLWIAQGNGQYVDMADGTGLDNRFTDMGVDLGDFDGDGDLDLYVTNIQQTVGGGNYEHNVLFRNDSAGSALEFTEIAQDQGVDAGYWGWGATFFDADNDGDLDLATTNGRQDRAPIWETDPSRLFLNNGQGPVWFTEASDLTGFNDTHIGSGLAALDIDRDGDLDLVQVTMDAGIRVLENQVDAPARSWLVVQPRKLGTDRFVPGTIVRVTAGGRSMIRLITAGKSTLSQEPFEAHFGLGESTRAEEVVVEAPDGSITRVHHVAANQVLTVEIDPDRIFVDGFE